jgi:hypothetical protein
MAVAAHGIDLLVFAERSAEFGLLVVHLGVEVGRELGDQIVLVVCGKITAHSVEVAIDETVEIVGCHVNQASWTVLPDNTW